MIKAHQHFDLFGKKIFEKVIIKPPFKVMAEMPDEACFYYVMEGWTTVTTPTEKVHTKTDDGLLLQCGNYINEYIPSEETVYCEAIGVHLYPQVLKMIYDKEFPDFLLGIGKIQPLNYQKYQSTTLLKSYIKSLQFYFDNPSLVSEELLKLKLKELILLLAKTNNAETIKNLIASMFSPYAHDFKEIIEANLFNNFSLEELAKLSNLSLSSFKREFTKHYNTSPAKYIRQRKLNKAAQLLKATKLRITEIAFESGFSDLAHFSKCFQKEYGTSPSDFRLD